ncbi:MAG: tetratricopeptide repeat protein [Candidatus Cloacimonetes bacterium]|nr:tetratricopeptide repeat protein [Candidatus Cloacimonadota bacterium]
MSHSSSITPVDHKIDFSIRIILYLIWGGLIVFGIISLLQPAWLTDISKLGRESEAYDLKKMADNLMAEENFEGAISTYQEAIKRDPELQDAMGNMAIAYSKQGKTDLAEKTLKELIAKLPERDYIGYLNLADISMTRKDYAQAREYYQKSLPNNPFPGEAYKFAGFCSKELGELELSLQYYNQAIGTKSDFKRLYTGSILRDLYSTGNSEETQQILEELYEQESSEEILKKYDEKSLHYVLNHDPEISKIYNEMGVIYHKMGKNELSNRAFRTALSIDPRNENARKNIRIVSKIQG